VIGSSSWLCGDWHFRLLSLAKSSRISSVDAVLVIPCPDLHWIMVGKDIGWRNFWVHLSINQKIHKRKIMYAFLFAKRSSRFWVPESRWLWVSSWGISPRLLTFSGTHALGGTRHSIETMRQWFQRLYILSLLNFTIKNIAVSGFPWDTNCSWVGWFCQTADASEYQRRSSHHQDAVGKVVYLHTYLDTQLTEALCKRLATV